MIKSKKWSNMLGLLAGLLGTAALWLPFYYNHTPFNCGRDDDWSLAILAWGGFLALPILISQVLGLLGKPHKKVRIMFAYFVSAAATLLPLVWVLLLWHETLNHHSPISTPLFISSPSLLIVANIVLLWRNLKSKREPELTCGIFLLGAYIPNALLAITFTAKIATWWGWNYFGVGAYLVLMTCVLCIGSIACSMLIRSEPARDSCALRQ